MERKNKEKGINLSDIFIGEVTLVKEIDSSTNILDEVVSVAIEKNAFIIGKSANARIKGLTLRKVVFVMKENEGIVLSKGLSKKNTYNYKVINSNDNTELDVKNNTIVIDDPKPIGDILNVIGYPNFVRKNDIKEIAKLVLSSNAVLSVRENLIVLNGSEIFNIEQVRSANEQAKELYCFKHRNLPVNPQKIEKVYAKYFKK